MYNIKLADGTELIDLKLNGNNYISKTIIEDSTFDNNLSEVIITGNEGATTYINVKLVQNKVYGKESWFILAEKTREELENETNQSYVFDLDYRLTLQELGL